MSNRPEGQIPEETEHPSNILESPWWQETRPRDAMVYFEGVAAMLAILGLKGRSISVGEEKYRAFTENELKYLANEAAWKAIGIFKDGEISIDGKGDYQDLENRLEHLLALVASIPHQESDRQPEYPINS